MTLNPLESGQYIASTASHVRLVPERIKKTAESIVDCVTKKEYSVLKWKQHKLHPQEMTDETADWIFVIDLLNFSFWSDDPHQEFTVDYKGSSYVDYWALCAAIRRAIEEGIHMVSPAYYKDMSLDKMKYVFRSSSGVDIPLLETRQKILSEAGQTLVEKFGGSFTNCIRCCGGCAQTLIRMVADNFPSFRDEAIYKSQQVSFYKRAQILVADIWACFESKGLGTFEDIHALTMFADYRVPQMLRYLGVFEYSEELIECLKKGVANQQLQFEALSWHRNTNTIYSDLNDGCCIKGTLLCSGDEREVEIRGCSIWAVELIRQQVEEKLGNGPTINSILIDFYLWESATASLQLGDNSPDYPIHRTRSSYY